MLRGDFYVDTCILLPLSPYLSPRFWPVFRSASGTERGLYMAVEHFCGPIMCDLAISKVKLEEQQIEEAPSAASHDLTALYAFQREEDHSRPPKSLNNKKKY